MLKYKLNQARNHKEKLEEIIINIDIIDGGKIFDLKLHLKAYIENPEGK